MLACENVMAEQKKTSCDQDESTAEESKIEERKGLVSLMRYWVTKPDLGLFVK